MRTRLLMIFGFVFALGFIGTAVAIHDPNQSQIHSIILPPDMKEKTFEEFMEWCEPYYGELCIELKEKRIPNILSPLIQFKSGISIDEIRCKEHLVLVVKYDDSPACVKEQTVPILIERNWIKDDSVLPFERVSITPEIGKTGVYKLNFEDKLFEIDYSIKGASIDEIDMNDNIMSVFVAVDSVQQGNLEITIPRTLLDSKDDYCPPRQENPSDEMFVVVIDGMEIPYDETITTKETRTLYIPFGDTAKKIEIIATCLF